MDTPLAAALSEFLSEPPPEVSAAEAEMLARKYFGVVGTSVPLPGERDRNFRIRCAAGTDWVLKVVSPQEDPAVTHLSEQALAHVARRDAGLPVPRVRLQHGGMSDGAPGLGPAGGLRPTRFRMFSYLQGTVLPETGSGPRRLRNLGAALARLDQALADFDHPAQRRDLVWDAISAERVRPLAHEAQDAAPLLRALDHFSGHVTPVAGQLRHQVIHNDANPNNVLISGRCGTEITGLIDFGDILRAPLVQELATAAAYQVLGTGHPLAGSAALAAGYHARCSLSPLEVAVLYDLTVARLVLGIVVADWRSRHRADRAHFLMRARQTRVSFNRLTSISCPDAVAYFHRELGR